MFDEVSISVKTSLMKLFFKVKLQGLDAFFTKHFLVTWPMKFVCLLRQKRECSIKSPSGCLCERTHQTLEVFEEFHQGIIVMKFIKPLTFDKKTIKAVCL
jgi:hypothetical protein